MAASIPSTSRQVLGLAGWLASVGVRRCRDRRRCVGERRRVLRGTRATNVGTAQLVVRSGMVDALRADGHLCLAVWRARGMEGARTALIIWRQGGLAFADAVILCFLIGATAVSFRRISNSCRGTYSVTMLSARVKWRASSPIPPKFSLSIRKNDPSQGRNLREICGTKPLCALVQSRAIRIQRPSRHDRLKIRCLEGSSRVRNAKVEGSIPRFRKSLLANTSRESPSGLHTACPGLRLAECRFRASPVAAMLSKKHR
jgi:hypothetical protein